MNPQLEYYLALIGVLGLIFSFSVACSIILFFIMFVSGDFWSILYTPIFWICSFAVFVALTVMWFKP
jgi:membrane-bound ClpP family serine protease